MKVNEEDVVENIFIASTLDSLMVFTSLGKVHWLKVYTIPDVLRTSKGKSIANLLPLKSEESIAGILSVKKFEEGSNLTNVLKSEIEEVFGLDESKKALFLERLDHILADR